MSHNKQFVQFTSLLLVKLPANLLFSYHQQTKRLKTHPLKIAGRSSLSHDKALVMGGIDIVWAKYFNLHINKLVLKHITDTKCSESKGPRVNASEHV